MRTLLIVTGTLTLLWLSSCKKDTAPVTLSEQEKNDLIFLREEEKMARDVYDHCFLLYGTNVFKNISMSEESHMSNVLALLNTYGIADPAAGMPAGQFKNETLQTTYNELITLANTSLVNALKVGATIEDLDISDIKSINSHTDKMDLANVYDLLNCGSRNHLRTFIQQLTSNGSNYTPQYINQAEFDAIVNSEKETCTTN